ncbi:MAG: hypothetical protein ACREGE_04375 [Candidatus Microsaccharimonas sp.]
MELLAKLENKILGWTKNIPNLPLSMRKWLAENVWWFTALASVLTGITVIGHLLRLQEYIAVLNNPFAPLYSSTTFVTLLVVSTIAALVFSIASCIILGLAVNPLKEKQKKGWVLLFVAWLVAVIWTVVTTVITFNPLSVFTGIIFGAIMLAASGYFLFEIHGQFAHVERSRGVKAEKKSK